MKNVKFYLLNTTAILIVFMLLFDLAYTVTHCTGEVVSSLFGFVCVENP